MIVARTINEIRQSVGAARAQGKTVGLVPTMGALHAGHVSLIRAAKAAGDFVVVSIFVNPTQFGPNEDYAKYPRTEQADLEACRAAGADAVFIPSVEEMYPIASQTEVTVKGIAAVLCGASRPGHFAGVATVVAKLFNIVAPDRAFFGAKDFQQTIVVRRMVADLNFPVQIVVCPTVREADGLAMSSRNRYLNASQRQQAPALYGALKLAGEMIRRGGVASQAVLAAMREHLAGRAPEGVIDYLAIVDPQDLTDVAIAERPVLVAMAVKFGPTRLIDNALVE
ncbi:MAG: pantoate--beta-alanine ligase [Phycisphaerae bacterium]|jgi:pantoate--beta-alanine ligase